MNAHANARAWHGDRKARTVKQQKTIEANTKALAVADKKVQIQLSKVMLSAPYWCRSLRASERRSQSIYPTYPAATIVCNGAADIDDEAFSGEQGR